MRTTKVLLNTIEKVKNFNNIAKEIDVDISLKNDKYVVDAKSILGIFSLDLNEVLTLVVMSDDDNEVNHVFDELEAFIVNN